MWKKSHWGIMVHNRSFIYARRRQDSVFCRYTVMNVQVHVIIICLVGQMWPATLEMR